ncbi:hypothetical protein [Planctomycetes bacterium Poly30]
MIVLLMFALGYAYIAQNDASIADRAMVTAQQEKMAADKLYEDSSKTIADRSKILGFTTDFATIPSSVEAAEASLENAKATFPDMGGVTTFEAAIPEMTKAYQAKVAQIGELQKTIATLTEQVKAERSAKSELEGQKNEIIATLTQEKTDLEDSLKSEITRLETASSEQRSKLESKTDEVVQVRDEVRLSARALEESQKAMSSTKANYTRKLNDITKRSEKPDGEISAVLSAYDMGIINLKASDRLSEGIVFNIVSGQPGADPSKPKGKARVTNVGTKFSEVEIFDVVDPLGQPVVQGDKIYNALYEPKGERNAVFAGNITGSYNKPELLLLFEEIGINVQNELSNTTDFLIVGGPMFVDEEGEPLEEPLQPESLPVYTEAIDKGVTIIPVRDVLQYFRR